MTLAKNKTHPDAYAAGLRDFRRGWGYSPKGHEMIRDSGRSFSHMVASYRAGYDQGEAEAIQAHEEGLAFRSPSCIASGGWMAPGF
jgi:hypothetical protein